MRNATALVLSAIADDAAFNLVKYDVADARTELELHVKRTKVREAEGERPRVTRVRLGRKQEESCTENRAARVHHRHEVERGHNRFGGLHEIIVAWLYHKLILHIAIFQVIEFFGLYSVTFAEPSRAIGFDIGAALNDFMHSTEPQVDARPFGIREITTSEPRDKVLLFDSPDDFVDADY